MSSLMRTVLIQRSVGEHFNIQQLVGEGEMSIENQPLNMSI